MAKQEFNKNVPSSKIKKIGPLVLGSFGKDAGFHGKDLDLYNVQHFSGRPWNLVDFMHEIWWISWNLVDFMAMKSGGFHGKDLYICIGSDEKYSILVVDHEIWQISCMKFGGFHAKDFGSDEKYSIQW